MKVKLLFNSLQSILNKYLCQGKKALCAFSKLTKHRNAGGMSHTHIQDYYDATLLAQLRNWASPESSSLWVELEQTQIPGGNLYNFLIASPHIRTLDTRLAPPILASIHSWMHVCKTQQWSGKAIPLRFPISTIQLLLPDLNLTTWMNRVFPSLKIYRLAHRLNHSEPCNWNIIFPPVKNI